MNSHQTTHKMSSLYTLLVLSGALYTVISGSVDDNNMSRNILKEDRVILSRDDEGSCQENYSCVNCTTVQVCGPTTDKSGLHVIKKFTCPTTNPWCDSRSATCIAEQPLECLVPVPADQFHCMRDGNYPLLSDCSSYYRCIDGNAYIQKCGNSKRYYDPNSEQCSTSNNCASSRICEGKSGIKVKVSSYNQQLFAYCANNTVSALDRCIGAYVFNITSQQCEKFCPNAGLFPSNEDCTKYYKCIPLAKRSTSFNITELTCPTGEGFLELAFECVNRTLVPNCNLTLPDLFSRK